MAWFNLKKNNSKDLDSHKGIVYLSNEKNSFSSSWSRIKEILTSQISDLNFYHEKEDGLDLLLKKGLLNLIRNLSLWLLENPQEKESYLYLIFNDKNAIYEPLAKFDNFEIANFYSLEEIEKLKIHSSRLVKINSFKTKEEIESLKGACRFLDKAYSDLVYQSQNSKILIFKQSTSEPADYQYGALTLEEKEKQKEIIQTIKDSSIFSIYGDQSLTTLDLKIDTLKELMHWAVKFISFQTGISSVRLGFDLASEEIDINDDFLRFINYIHKIFTKPLINNLLEKLELKSEWSFKPIPLANAKEKLIAEKNLSETIEKYTKILKEITEVNEPFLYEKVKEKIEFLLLQEL